MTNLWLDIILEWLIYNTYLLEGFSVTVTLWKSIPPLKNVPNTLLLKKIPFSYLPV